MNLNRDLRAFVALLNAKNVDYVVVITYALAFYGHARFTGDIDILIRPDSKNAATLADALTEFGFWGLSYSGSDILEKG